MWNFFNGFMMNFKDGETQLPPIVEKTTQEIVEDDKPIKISTISVNTLN